MAKLCGDFDADGDVDTNDRNRQTVNWTGAGAEPGTFQQTFAQGDCNGDGDIDTADLNSLVQNWTGAIQAEQDDVLADLVVDPGIVYISEYSNHTKCFFWGNHPPLDHS